MKTKREVLEQFAKCGNCEGIKCTDCPYDCPYDDSKHCLHDDLRKIGAMAILRQNRKKRKFDPNKVLTCVTADQAKVGMRGYVADDLWALKNDFKNNVVPYELVGIRGESYACRFETDDSTFVLFYPIEEEVEE